MSDQAFGRLGRKSENVEDRRNEFSELDHLLMQLGLMPMPEQDAEARRQLGLKPGEWLDVSDPNVMPPTSVLSLDAGANDLDNQFTHRLMLGQR